MSLAIETHALRKSFGNVHALRGVELSVPTNSTFGLVGPNGAGKTSLFSIIAGFLRTTSGTVSVLGEPLESDALRGRVAVLPQDAGWRKRLAVGTQMILCAQLQGMTKPEAELEVRRVLALTDMADCFARSPESLSHGMAKRVAIAQAFIGDPQLVLLDEPLAGLDPGQARRIRTLIQEQAGKRTFVISSHVMSDIETLCSHVAIIKEGEIVAQPSMADLTRREAVVVFTLSEPPQNGLAQAFESLDYVAKVELRAVERKVQLTVITERKELDSAVGEFIAILSQQGASFVGMQKGTSLEDAVVDA